LNDISTLLGGKVFNSTVGDDFSKAKLEDLGIATKVRVSRTTTMLINDNAIQEHINERVALLSSQLDNQTNDWFREKIHRRIGKLTGGVAVVKVGAATETELRERKERLDDALNATKCAVQEGIVVGGGMALYDWVLKQKPSPINSAFSAPTNVIASNAGVSLNSNKLLEGLGFNANTNKYQNLLEAGVIDPVKVTKNAVLTATSIAGLVLTTNVLVGEKEEPQWG
jgi:chaperonin GroEL